MELVKIICAIILPPLGVFLQVGLASKHFWINIVATLFGYLPGVAHAIWVVATTPTRVPATAAITNFFIASSFLL